MVIGTNLEYVKFYMNLNMEDSVSLASFINNEKRVLKSKLENKNIDKEKILKGIDILNNLTREINEYGVEKILEKYGKQHGDNTY